MKNKIKIPVALQLIVDDVGWHNGEDERPRGGSARSGLPRMHQPEDYRALNAIGEGLNMKIVCSLVLGDWDKDNLLRGVPHVTNDPEGWDRASAIDMDYAKRCFEALDGAEYLDYAIHGLMHGYFVGNKLLAGTQYYPCRYDEEKQCYTTERTPLPEEEFENQVRLFLEIYKSWGFTKKIENFVSTSGTVGTYEDNRGFAAILQKYGVKYWSNSWAAEKTEKVAVKEGVICLKEFGIMPWNAYDVDPEYLELAIKEDEPLPALGYGVHWTNFLRYNYQKNMERVPAWIDYFKRQAECFGVMLSRDNGFAASQALYYRFAQMEMGDGKCTIDLEQVDAQKTAGLTNQFYISLKNGLEPVGCTGGQIRLYETKKEFCTYQITRDGSSRVEILF